MNQLEEINEKLSVKKCIKRRITYMVSHLFRTKLQGLIEDVNWNNFNHKQFSCENIDIFEKKIVVSFSSTKDVFKT